MINKINKLCENLNNALGISVSLPNPGKKALKTAMVCNLTAGTCLIMAGTVSSSKWYTILGSICIISTIILQRENNNKE